jgi:hypothetical protein
MRGVLLVKAAPRLWSRSTVGNAASICEEAVAIELICGNDAGKHQGRSWRASVYWPTAGRRHFRKVRTSQLRRRSSDSTGGRQK